MTRVSPPVRYSEIDMLKGLACLLMLIGHAVRVNMPPPNDVDKIFLYLMDFSGPIFFFVSGMNVMTFLSRNRDKPGFAYGKFYVAAAALLFLLGYTYNVNRASLSFFDIFQGVAICTVLVFWLMRTRLPLWAHLAFVAFMFLFATQFRMRLQMDMIVPDFAALKASIPSGADITNPAMTEAVRTLLKELGPIRRILFVHFGVLPWIVYFYMGALCYRALRLENRKTWPWWIGFGLIAAAGPAVHWLGRDVFPHMFLDSYLDLMLRGIPSYVLFTLGGAGLAFLVGKRWYRGAAAYSNKVVRFWWERLELLGKESLMFLVVHWWVITMVMLVQNTITAPARLAGREAPELDVWLRAAIVAVLVMILVPWFAKKRNQWQAHPHYGRRVGVFMALSIVLAVLVLPAAPPLAHLLTYGSSFGFAFLYPHLRGRLRKKYTTDPPAPAKPEEMPVT